MNACDLYAAAVVCLNICIYIHGLAACIVVHKTYIKSTYVSNCLQLNLTCAPNGTRILVLMCLIPFALWARERVVLLVSRVQGQVLHVGHRFYV